MDVAKLAPFAAAAPDFDEPEGLRIWLTEPLGMVTQVDVGFALTEAMTAVMVGPAYNEMRILAGGDHPFFFIHDFADVEKFEPGARSHLVRWPPSIGRANIEKIVVCLNPEGANSVFQMAVRLGASAIGMAGYHVTITTDPLAQVIASYDMRPAPAK